MMRTVSSPVVAAAGCMRNEDHSKVTLRKMDNEKKIRFMNSSTIEIYKKLTKINTIRASPILDVNAVIAINL